MTELDDRRQHAREAAYDNPHISDRARTSGAVRAMLNDAIETATRVRITPEITGAYLAALHGDKSMVSGLIAAFRAAGFEVEE